ncbi:DNA-binding SARP family transcriptional activator [Arthrobacter sp. UYCu511]|uniref:AfsR/SARP family transcriptional regulator n=1 Tax=Arthrobacter sp. UYCu511 TaxID=3156337 RepID=UPI0033974A6B
MSQLRIRVLGAIGADVNGIAVRLSKARHREILGILITARGRTVSTQQLVEDLWEEPPAGAVGAVRTFIGELRRILEPQRPPHTPPAVLLTTGGGYLLRLEPDAVDLRRAETAIKAAGGMAAATREFVLATALQEWHGAAFEEFTDRGWARGECTRIAGLRANILEQLAAARLALGRPEDAVELLASHTDEHPWREEGWRLLALAHYRAARRGEALDVLVRARSVLQGSLGLHPGAELADLELRIHRQDPALDADDAGHSLLLRTVTGAAGTGTRSGLEGVAALVPLLAVSGSVHFAAQQRRSAIEAAEQVGDPELTGRVITGFDVPSCWTRPDDPEVSAAIVAAGERTLVALPAGSSERVRARLLATVAMESRGITDRLVEAAEAEAIARRLNDPALLCLALSARYLQTFSTAGLAKVRDTLGGEIIALAVAAELPTFEIEGRLIRMQALCALDDIAAASAQAAAIDQLAARHDRALASVFTAWFRWTFADGPPPPAGSEMPGFRSGLAELAALTAAVRTGGELPDGDFGPYEPWVRPLLLVRTGHTAEALSALGSCPDPPLDLLMEVAWFLIGLAALESGHRAAAQHAYQALLPAAAERAAGSGAVDLGPVQPLLEGLGRFLL